MAIPSLFRGYGIRIATDDIASTTIGGITNYNIRDNVSVERETTGGDIYASLTTLTGHDETMEFTSLNIDDVLDVVGTTGICLSADDSLTGFEFFLTKLDECTAGPSVGADNMRYRLSSDDPTDPENLGLIWPGTLSIPHSGNAEFSFNVTPRVVVSSGNSIVITENVSLPAIPDSLKRFGMGPVEINDVTFEGKQSVDINFGVSITQESADGSLFPEWIAIDKVLAVITIRGINVKWALAANIPRGGRSFAHANAQIYARRKDPTALSGFYGTASTEHVKFTAHGKAYITDLATGNASAPTQTALVMYVEKDNSNAPLIASTGVAITGIT